jgi:4-hydroxybenzoate polyprenyltransferase
VPAAGRLSLYASLLRLDKPVGTLLLLWPTLTALWLASSGRPAPDMLAVFVLGTFLMRSAGCAINDAADFRYDAQVKRTAQRVVAQGLISPREAVAVATLLAGLSALLLLFLNDAALRLAIAAVAIAATYPLIKRFFPVPQLYLGVAFSFGIPMAFAAVQGEVPLIGWWLFIANNFWVVAYDTEYAMVDRDDDLRIGIRSSAIFFGRADVAVVMACYGAYLSLLLLLGNATSARWPFYLGCGIAFGFALYHYMLIRERTREGCLQAFRHNNWVGLAVFAGTVLDYAIR